MSGGCLQRYRKPTQAASCMYMETVISQWNYVPTEPVKMYRERINTIHVIVNVHVCTRAWLVYTRACVFGWLKGPLYIIHSLAGFSHKRNERQSCTSTPNCSYNAKQADIRKYAIHLHMCTRISYHARALWTLKRACI